MKVAAIAFALVLAQTPVGNWLTRPEYQTYAAATYYVSPDGGGTTCSVSAPCATLNAPIAKLPRYLRHNVTVNVAAGTYTMATPLVIDGITMADGVSLTFQGDTNWSTYTPSSGSGTGTLTGVSALSFPTYYTLTDSAQTWPAWGMTAGSLGLRGRFVCFTSGAASGTKYPVGFHSATTLGLSATPSPAPSAGTTYTLCNPSTAFTAASATFSGGQAVLIGGGNGEINFNDMSFTMTGSTAVQSIIRLGGTGTHSLRENHGRLLLTRVRVEQQSQSASFGGVYAFATSQEFRLTNSSVASHTTTLGASVTSAVSVGTLSLAQTSQRVVISGSYLRAQRQALSLDGTTATVSGNTLEVENQTANDSFLVNRSTLALTNTWLGCYVSNGLSLVQGLTLRTGSRATIASLKVEGCWSGVDLRGTQNNNSTVDFGATFAATSASASNQLIVINPQSYATGVRLAFGANVNYPSAAVYTATGVADGGRAWVCPDGATSYTDAQVQALPSALLSCGGSMVQR